MKKAMRVTLGLIFVIVIPALYVVLFQPSMIVNNVESTIAGQLQQSIGPAAMYKVKIDSPLHRLVRGDMGDVAITGHQVRLQNGMVAEQLKISLDNVNADLKTGTITSISNDAFSVTISQNDLNSYIAAVFSDIPDLTVEMKEGMLAVSTRQEIAFIKSRVRFNGTLEIENGDKLMLRLHDLKAGKVRIPGIIRGRIERKLNPILHTGRWTLGTELKKVMIHKGRIEVYGKVDPKDLAAMQSSARR